MAHDNTRNDVKHEPGCQLNTPLETEFFGKGYHSGRSGHILKTPIKEIMRARCTCGAERITGEDQLNDGMAEVERLALLGGRLSVLKVISAFRVYRRALLDIKAGGNPGAIVLNAFDEVRETSGGGS